MKKISIVIPCYCSEKSIEDVINEDKKIFAEKGLHDYEFILVNDASPDNTWSVIKKLAVNDPKVKSINLTKNVGQHGAIMAGFRYVSGDYIVVSDDDGQTQMNVIDQMIQSLENGYDVASTYWKERGQRSLLRRLGTGLNVFVAKALMDQPDDVVMSIFFAAKKYVIDEIVKYDNPYPYITGLVLRTTHNIATIETEQLARKTGQSGYTFVKLLKLWMNGYTAFSIKPLRISTILGFLSSLVGVILGLYIIIRKIVFNDVLTGWSSIVATVLFMSGMILCVLGMIGEYVGRIYMCINKTPQYCIKEVVKKEESIQERN